MKKIAILGAAGRDFHNFNVCFRDNASVEVVAFTAAQIPNIAGRVYPPELAGGRYPKGIPIYPESELPALIRKHGIQEVVFSYSDVSNQFVMSLSALANACGAEFTFLGAEQTMLKSRKKVISICAVRTGCGKSQTARVIADILQGWKKKAAVVRHPMPYGDLAAQRCQRFETVADLDKFHCTIEEREEYEQHIVKGHLLFAGVDYEAILHAAEKEADVILWDGGNNDLPFFKPDLHIVLADALRPGHELTYYPSQTNVRLADLVLISKSGSAKSEDIQLVEKNIKSLNPTVEILRSDSIVTVDDPSAITGKRVLVVEDGPTLTHGGMAFGAGTVAARRYEAARLVDPRPFAVGSIRRVFEEFPHLTNVLPAMGYSDEQVRELTATIEKADCDVVLVGTPIDLTKVITTRHPVIRARYNLDKATEKRLYDRCLKV